LYLDASVGRRFRQIWYAPGKTLKPDASELRASIPIPRTTEVLLCTPPTMSILSLDPPMNNVRVGVPEMEDAL
jgi:hypothetical protein